MRAKIKTGTELRMTLLILIFYPQVYERFAINILYCNEYI